MVLTKFDEIDENRKSAAHHDPRARLEAVHLHEHLVERVLALVVAAAAEAPGAALAPDLWAGRTGAYQIKRPVDMVIYGNS